MTPGWLAATWALSGTLKPSAAGMMARVSVSEMKVAGPSRVVSQTKSNWRVASISRIMARPPARYDSQMAWVILLSSQRPLSPLHSTPWTARYAWCVADPLESHRFARSCRRCKGLVIRLFESRDRARPMAQNSRASRLKPSSTVSSQ